MKRNPYRWLPRKDKDKKEGKKTKEKDKAWPTSPSEEEHIKKVTQVTLNSWKKLWLLKIFT